VDSSFPANWRYARPQIDLYTKQTMDDIPNVSGCYAWFLPLWIYDEDINKLLHTINWFLLYDAQSEDSWPRREAEAQFYWERSKIALQKMANVRLSPEVKNKWERVTQNQDQKKAISRALMEATIYTPPLYIGRANNLRRRYMDHVSGKTDFAERFNERAKKTREKNLNFPLEINDLVFICIKTPKEIHEALEQLLIRACKPSFSLK